MVKNLYFLQNRKLPISSRIFSLVLAICMVVLLTCGGFPNNVQAVEKAELHNPLVDRESMAAGKKVTWDCLYFGSYPQTEVKKTDSEYDALKTAEGWNENGDIDINGVRYRRILREDATHYGLSSQIEYFSWEDKNTYHYFKYEPIKWRVLNVDGEHALLLADIALDDQYYDTSGGDITWEGSTIRSWLNGYDAGDNFKGVDYSGRSFFDSAFNEAEQEAIAETAVKNADNLKYGTDGGNATKDKLFLLSESEVYTEMYGFVKDSKICDEARRLKSSDYAKAMGVKSDCADEGTCNWWLRSPGNYSDKVVSVDSRGNVNNIGVDIKYGINNIRGIRMALNLNLSFINCYTYGGTVCSDGTIMENSKTNIINIKNPRTVSVLGMDERKIIWDCVYFGNYPQTEIKSTDRMYNELQQAEGWDFNGDIIIGGNKYRRISKSDATQTSEKSGYYHWEDDYTYHYFKYEPIKWRVLSMEGEQALLLSDIVLDGQRYNITSSSDSFFNRITWETSTIRSWLNGYDSENNEYGNDYSKSNFMDIAFDSEEQELIAETNVSNISSLKCGTMGGNDTTDKVFLLSEAETYTKEAKKYGFVSEYYIEDISRRCKSSDYANAMGVYNSTSEDIKGNCNWWLRSPGDMGTAKSKANFVCPEGDVNIYGSYVDEGNIGVRMALSLNISADDFYTYAGTLCNDGTVGTTWKPSTEEPSTEEPSTEEASTEELTTEKPQIKKTQTIKVTKSYKKTYGAKSFRLNVKLTKGNGALKYKTSNKSVVTVDKNGKVIIQGTGICIITVTASATDIYKSASAKITITVKPKKNMVTKVKTSGKRVLRVTWKKDKTCTGYELQYSTSRKFSSRNTALLNISKNKTTSYKIKGLKKGKKYYVRVRTYRNVKVNGKTKKLYGNWSTIKQSGKIK